MVVRGCIVKHIQNYMQQSTTWNTHISTITAQKLYTYNYFSKHIKMFQFGDATKITLQKFLTIQCVGHLLYFSPEANS